MMLKNFHKVLAETPPEITEKVERWMDKQDRLHEGKCNLCIVYGDMSPMPRGVSVEIDMSRLYPRPKLEWTQSMLDDLNKLCRSSEALERLAREELGLF